MRDVSGRGAVVTGGASGTGLGIARTLAREGCNIPLLDVDAAALERARVEIEALGVRAITHRVNRLAGSGLWRHAWCFSLFPRFAF